MSKQDRFQSWKTFKQGLSDTVTQSYLNRDKYRNKLKSNLLKIKDVFRQESQETKEMVQIYQKYLRGESSPEEMESANEQFRDLLRGLGLGVIVVLPFSPITIPLVVKLGQRLGIEVFPSSLRNQTEKPKNS